MVKRAELKMGYWHFKFGLIPLYFAPHRYLFHIGIFKLVEPLNHQETAKIAKEDYKGFWFRKYFTITGFEWSWSQEDEFEKEPE